MAAANAPAPAAEEQNWFPIESNPPAMNEYAAKLGWPTGELCFHDILAMEEWAYEMLPDAGASTKAVLMLFPIKAASEAHKAEEDARVKAGGQTLDPRVYFAKQTIGNACGTIGMLHACLNTSTLTGGSVALPADSWLSRFFARTAGMDADARAKALEVDGELQSAHTTQVQAGQSAVVEDSNNHFVCFVEKGGCLYELDGRKSFPINHGPCGGAGQPDVLHASAAVIAQFMGRDPEELRFTMVALAPPAPEEE